MKFKIMLVSITSASPRSNKATFNTNIPISYDIIQVGRVLREYYDSRKLTVTQNYTTGYYSFSKFIDIDNITTVPTEIELKL